MIKYMRLQLFLVSKRISTYVVPAVFALSLFLLIGLPIVLAGSPLPNKVNSAILILPFIISAIFVAIKSLNIFKDSEEDGTELLIVSKPITRFRLVLGKFISLYTLIIFFSIFVFAISAFIGSLDEDATTKEILKFATSMAVGTVIIQWLLSSVIVFTASILGKIGTMTVSIVLPLTLAFASPLLVSLSGSTLSGPIDNDFSHKYVVQNSNGEWEEKALNGYDTHAKNVDRLQDVLKSHEKSWYKSAAYFDVWTQLSSFYSIFQTKEVTPSTSSKWVETNEHSMLTDKMDHKLVFELGNKKYYIAPKENAEEQFLLNITDASKLYKEDSTEVAKMLKNMPKALDAFDLKVNVMNKINSLSGTNFLIANNDGKAIVSYFLVNILNEDPNVSINNILKGGKPTDLDLAKDEIDYTLIKGSPYIPTSSLYVIWLIITFGVGGLVILRYSRRDFK